MNLGQPGSAGQFCLVHITGNEGFRPEVLCGGDVDKIPSACRALLGMTGAQLIAPFQ